MNLRLKSRCRVSFLHRRSLPSSSYHAARANLMSYFFKPAVIASALFFGALTIGAQTYRDDSYYRRDNPSAFGLRLCDRVQADLSGPLTIATAGGAESVTLIKKSRILSAV